MARTWIGIVASALLVACGDGGARCVTGLTVECPCACGGTGIQICQADGTFGACQCAEPDGGAPLDAGPPDAGPPDASAGDAGQVADGGDHDAGPDGGDPCAGVLTYAGTVENASSVWATLPTAGGLTGLEAGHQACRAIGADHACDYLEVTTAEARGELASIPAGTSAWLQRTTTVPVGGVDSLAGPGGNCIGWTFSGNHIADGEYITFAATGTPTYHFDGDTFFDSADTTHVTAGDLDCGGVTRAILCCYAACE